MSETVKIYLAGGCVNEADEGRGWRTQATEIFKQSADKAGYNIKIINPLDYFSYSEAKHQSDSQIKKYYMDQILHSRIVLVNLTNSNKSCGTSQELQYAVDHDIPVVGWYSDPDGIYNWHKVDCQCIFPSLLQAIDYILEYYLN